MFIVPTKAQNLTTISLNAPGEERGSNMMEALANRRSTREFSSEKLCLQDLSDLLWAANGVNRPDGRRTPVCLLLVSDLSRFGNADMDTKIYLEYPVQK